MSSEADRPRFTDVDPAAGFAVGWNMYFNQAALVIFELVNFGVTIVCPSPSCSARARKTDGAPVHADWESAANVNITVYIA